MSCGSMQNAESVDLHMHSKEVTALPSEEAQLCRSSRRGLQVPDAAVLLVEIDHGQRVQAAVPASLARLDSMQAQVARLSSAKSFCIWPTCNTWPAVADKSEVSNWPACEIESQPMLVTGPRLTM